MKAAVIRVAATATAKQNEYPGWIVPDTNDLLGIDERVSARPANADGDDFDFGADAVWVITHLPTGHRMNRPGWTDAATKERAAGIAQRFYREAIARGWDLTSTDPVVIAAGHNKMTAGERDEFWKIVGTDPEPTPPTSNSSETQDLKP